MSPMNPTHAFVAHWYIGAGRTGCGLRSAHSEIRVTPDPTLVTCKRCLKAMQKPARI